MCLYDFNFEMSQNFENYAGFTDLIFHDGLGDVVQDIQVAGGPRGEHIGFVMPRGPRLDAVGALHHMMVRGIERRKILRSREDREDLLDRLAE